MKKRLLAIFLLCVFALTIGTPAFASDLKLSDANSGQIITRAHDMEYKRELAGTIYKTVTLEAGGQPSGGVRFSSAGGSFIWSDGSNPVQISISGYLGPFSLNVASGSTSTGGSTGYGIPCPYVNKYCKLYVIKTIKVQEYGIYERFAGTTGNWTLISKEYYDSLDNLDFVVRLV